MLRKRRDNNQKISYDLSSESKDINESDELNAEILEIPDTEDVIPAKNAMAEGPKKNNPSHIKKSLWRGVKIFFIMSVTVILVLAGAALYYSRDLPSIEQLEVYEPKLSTKVYSLDGKVIKEFYKERRTRVPFQEIPKNVIHALLATEDHRFYEHWGVDLIRFVKALGVNVVSLSSKEGFSSLTQQLARNLYFGSEKTLSRKYKEILTALQIERKYSKNEIIEMYLTHMYFGHQAYGIHSAAKIFFAKEVKNLSLEETAYLVGHLQSPSYFMYNLKAADQRKNVVLKRMLDCGYITAAEYDSARTKKVRLVLRYESDDPGSAPYFSEHVRMELESMKEKLKINLYEDGLKVYTTLDTRLQAIANKAYQQSVAEKFEGLDRFGAKVIKGNPAFYLKKYLSRDNYSIEEINRILSDKSMTDSMAAFYGTVQAAFVAMDPTNGHILAMIGGRDFQKYKLNHVTQIKRQAGSTFKPFLYTAAIDNGYSPSYKVLNQDVVLIMENGTRWTPQNYDGSRGGPTTLREALAKSLNLVSVRLMQQVVPATQVVQYAQRMGITTPMPAVDALALGVSDVIPLELVTAYAVFANKGVLTEPVSILKIEDRNGNIIWQNIPKRKEVLSPETAYIMTDMMKSGIDAEFGTGRFARRYGFDRIAAVKTGTTQKWTDGWFVGYTPRLVAGVWVGYDTYEFNLGSKNPGAVVASPLWGRFMAEAYKALDLPAEDFDMPAGVVKVEICEESGLLANPACPKKYFEVFNSKFQPIDFCDIHTGKTKANKKKKSNRY